MQGQPEGLEVAIKFNQKKPNVMFHSRSFSKTLLLARHRTTKMQILSHSTFCSRSCQHKQLQKGISLQNISRKLYVNTLFRLSSWTRTSLSGWTEYDSNEKQAHTSPYRLLNSSPTFLSSFKPHNKPRTAQLPLQKTVSGLQVLLQIWLRAINASINSTLISLKQNLLLQSEI